MSEFGNELKNVYLRYESAKYNFFKWRFESAFINKVMLALGFACLTGLLAQIRFHAIKAIRCYQTSNMN